ncbi:MAG: 3-phosphoshikimate 1-carboxyvinyltransferase [Oscillospiraceae bacterium]
MEIKQLNLFPNGDIIVPPSKSFAHRALICAALSKGKSVVNNISNCDDINATLNCINSIGSNFIQYEKSVVFDGENSISDNIILDCNESGSTLRFFIPIIAALGITAQFTGKPSLLRRPIAPYLKVFANTNVKIVQTFDKIEVSGQLSSGKYYIEGNVSSQFITGLLLALPLCDGKSEIVLTTQLESKNYVDITIDVMRSFGVNVINNDYKSFVIAENQHYKSLSYTVEGDYSNAAFFLVMSALGANLNIVGLNPNSLQGDKEILNIIEKVGSKINYSDNSLTITAKKFKPIVIDASQIPDLVPAIAVLLSFCEGESKIINAARLRLKESDRLNSIATELNKLGGNIQEELDGLTIKGINHFTGGVTYSHNDHRIAMMIAAASLKCTDKISLIGYNCVNKSYPDFWENFEKIH